jgi:hypothetical protein
VSDTSTYDTNESFGYLKIYAINPLRAPSTVPTGVSVLVEVAGAPDVEFSCLRTSRYDLYAPAAPQSSIKFVSSANEITSGDIGNAQMVDDNMNGARHCIGERVLSFNSVLKHTDRIVPTTQGTTALSLSADPFGIYTSAFVVATDSSSPYKSDLYSMITSMYSMSRGSVRYRVFNLSPTSINSTERNRAYITYSGVNAAFYGILEVATALPVIKWGLSVVQNQIYRGCVEIQTPPYHHTYARTNVNSFYGSGLLSGNRSFPSASKLVVNIETSIANGNIIKRQVADDFQCAQFISTPCTRYT